MNYRDFLYSLLPRRMKRQVRELFASTLLVNMALAMVIIFEPIYLYQIGYSLQKIMLFYLIAYVLYFFLMPLGAKFARRKGYELGIFVGTAGYMIYYITLFFIAYQPILFFIAPIILALQKVFYWPAYHADFARFSDDSEEGREISSMAIISSLTFIVGPALAGLIISLWGYGALFITVSLVFLLSNVPTLITKEKVVSRSFSYWGTFKDLLNKKNRKTFFAYLGHGEELILLVVWPVFISIIIVDVLNIGLIIALAALITAVFTLYIGKLSDFNNKRKILGIGSAFYSLVWFVRIFIVSQIGIFFVDTMSKLSKNIITIPLMALTYERAKSRDVMKTIVFFEMSLVAGKVLAMLLIYIALFFIADEIIAFKLTFILAGAMSLLYLLF